MAPSMLLAAAVCLLSTASALNFQTSLQINSPLTVPFDQSLRPFNENQATDAYESVNSTGNTPSQVHLSPGDANEMYVHWATGTYKTGNGTLPAPALIPSIVMYGTSPSALNLEANGTTSYYEQLYPANTPEVNITNSLNYTSPALHFAVLEDLEPNTTYYYSVGDGTTMSGVFSFKSLNDAGASPADFPQRLITVADWGLSLNSTSTLQHMLYSAEGQKNGIISVIVGDHVYSDNYYANGTYTGSTGPNGTYADGFEGNTGNTWQPAWDAWFNLIEPFVSEVPMLTNCGNHEIEQQYDANYSIFTSAQARWKTNGDPNYSPDSYFFHSSDAGPVHMIVLSNYVDYTPGSPQWTWLNLDLAAVNRSVTPWVVVNFHNPWYTTDSSYKEFEQMRISLEPLTYQYGVDVFFYGHVHSYERTAPVNNYVVDPCGSVHITIGDAGNGEGLSGIYGDPSLPDLLQDTEPYYEDFLGCPNITSDYLAGFFYQVPGANTSNYFSYYKPALTFQADGNSTGAPGQYPNGFCYKEQPLWSQYRESSFGHGVLDFMNATHALWQWHRNQDSVAVAADQTYIVRNTTQCPNKLGSANPIYSTGMVPGVTMTSSA